MLTFPHQSNTCSPQNSEFFCQSLKSYYPKHLNWLRDMSQKTWIWGFSGTCSSFSEHLLEGGEISPNATSRLRDSSSVRCRNMMRRGSCSLAGGAGARAAKQLSDSTVMTLPNGSAVFKWEDLAPVLIIHHSWKSLSFPRWGEINKKILKNIFQNSPTYILLQEMSANPNFAGRDIEKWSHSCNKAVNQWKTRNRTWQLMKAYHIN